MIGIGGFLDWEMAGEPLLREALQAVRRYNEAKGAKPVEKIECLRLEAEALMTAVSEYQLRVLGGAVQSLH